jgi:hypothetical protein
MGTSIQVVFASREPSRLATFWRTALRYKEEDPPSGFATWEEFAEPHGIDLAAGTDIDSAVDPDGVGPRLLFERDDPHARGILHLDVNVGRRGQPLEERRALVDAEADRLKAAGVAVTRVVDREGHYWVEMTDSEGNWFCVQ